MTSGSIAGDRDRDRDSDLTHGSPKRRFGRGKQPHERDRRLVASPFAEPHVTSRAANSRLQRGVIVGY